MFGGAYVGQAIGGAGVLFLLEYVPFVTSYALVVGVILSVTVFISIRLNLWPLIQNLLLEK